MTLKINISSKGKTWKLEAENSVLEGKSIADVVDGKTLKPELEGYELKIAGGSDLAGFPMTESVEGIALKKVLLSKGWGFSGKSKDGKLPNGIRKRKTVRGKTIAETTVQVNMVVQKEGSKNLSEIFPEQNVKKVEEKPNETKPEDSGADKAEEKPEVREEAKKEESSEDGEKKAE